MTGLAAFGPDGGELLIRTGVAGRAARMGHRLTLLMRRWQASVEWAGDLPVAAQLTVEVDSLQVVAGEGGVKALSGPEKALVRTNALRTLDAGRYPTIDFTAEEITSRGDDYRLSGILQIRGSSRAQLVRVHRAGQQLSSDTAIRQSDFGVRPYSLLMGSLQVTDEVTVSLRYRDGAASVD